MANDVALLDACTLYPYALRDTLLHLAATGLFRARWTDQIHDEWIRALLRKGGDPAKLQRTRELMNRAVRDCLVTDYEPLVDRLDLPDPDDRHVLAAAIVGRADVIVTTNLKHFPSEKLLPFGIEPQHPDDFIVRQLDLNLAAAIASFRRQRESLRSPPMDAGRFLDSLSRVSLPLTVERLREHAGL